MGITHSEARRLLKPHAVRSPYAQFSFCRLDHDAPKDRNWHQQQVGFDELEQLMTVASVKPEPRISYYIGQSTFRPGSWSRTLTSVMLLNAAWADIDLLHPPPEFKKMGFKAPAGDPESLAELLVRQIIDAGLPEPTYVVASGGGLVPKWVFTEPLPTVARVRWETLQKQLMIRIGQIVIAPGVRWPVDDKAKDAARVLRLVGSENPKWHSPCWICWDGRQEYQFNHLRDLVLPFTDEERRQRREKAILGKEWDANRARARAIGLRKGDWSTDVQLAPTPQVTIGQMIDTEAVSSMWCGRLEFGMQVLAGRGPLSKGDRNNYFWPMAAALAWSCGGVDTRLMQDLSLLHQDLFRGDNWTKEEAFNSASSVIRRLNKPAGWGKGNYKFKTSTWLKALEATAEEIREYGHLLGDGSGSAPKPRNSGAMGMPPMRGLDFNGYMAETRSRQARGGAYAASIRNTTRPETLRQQAREMAAKSMTTRQIGEAIGVHQSTVVRWLHA